MCSFTPSPAMSKPELDRKTLLAVAELMQTAAHRHGLVGPVPYDLLPDREPEPKPKEEEFFYAQHNF